MFRHTYNQSSVMQKGGLLLLMVNWSSPAYHLRLEKEAHLRAAIPRDGRERQRERERERDQTHSYLTMPSFQFISFPSHLISSRWRESEGGREGGRE
jgi:hypothetical protein